MKLIVFNIHMKTNTYKCPVCQSVLIQSDNSQHCPKHHGHLMTAKSLASHKVLSFESLDETSKVGHGELSCPACDNELTQIDYNSTGVIIDSCTKCHHRWLDASEIEKIKEHEPKISGEDLLFIENLERESFQEELLPDVGGLKYARHVYAASQFIPVTETKRSRNMIIASGIMAIIKMLFHSKFSRILVLIMLAIFAVLFAYVYFEMS